MYQFYYLRSHDDKYFVYVLLFINRTHRYECTNELFFSDAMAVARTEERDIEFMRTHNLN